MNNKKRILLVDDEESITRSLKLFLDGTGQYEVRTENRGSLAVQVAREFRPDLIVLDLVMAAPLLRTSGTMPSYEMYRSSS